MWETDVVERGPVPVDGMEDPEQSDGVEGRVRDGDKGRKAVRQERGQDGHSDGAGAAAVCCHTHSIVIIYKSHHGSHMRFWDFV